MEQMNIPTKIAIKHPANPNWNPVFNSTHVGVDDEAAGSFLVITADNEQDDADVKLDWSEWDEIVKTVAKYRSVWEWK